MIIYTVPMTMLATILTLFFIIVAGQSWDAQKYKEYPAFTIVSWWSLFLWMLTADAVLWYLVSISK